MLTSTEDGLTSAGVLAVPPQKAEIGWGLLG